MYKKLCEVANIIMGESPKSKYYNFNNNGMPFIQGKANFGVKYPNVNTWTTMYKKIANKGDILFTVRAPVGDINIANNKIAIGRGVAAISSNIINNSYLYYLLEYNKKNFIKSSKGTIYESINKFELDNITLKIHSNILQQHIVNTILILLKFL